VLYRLQRVTALLHVDLEDPDSRFLLQTDAAGGETVTPAPRRTGSASRLLCTERPRLEVVWSEAAL